MSAFGEFVQEQMAGFGPVNIRPMFGGEGVFRDGLMFALIAEETLYFKADQLTRARFEERGLAPFTYRLRGKTSTFGYFTAPEEVLDDAGAMKEWAGLGWGAALRAAHAKAEKDGAKRERP